MKQSGDLSGSILRVMPGRAGKQPGGMNEGEAKEKAAADQYKSTSAVEQVQRRR